jgi:predicted methyltransferase
MLVQEKLAAGLSVALLVLAACTAPSTRQETTEDLTRILAGSQRSEEERARDAYRHPKQTLLFFGIRPEMRVLEVWPEPGWYTEILAPLLRDKGQYYAALIAADPSSPYNTKRLAAYREKLTAHPELYDRVQVVSLPTDGGDGVLGIVEHRGNPAVPQDPRAKSGYVNEDYAIRLIEAQGFRLVAKSQVNSNPRDTKDYEQGVWTLPPSYRLGDKDHDKYAAIGESDRFTMRFVKPR